MRSSLIWMILQSRHRVTALVGHDSEAKMTGREDSAAHIWLLVYKCCSWKGDLFCWGTILMKLGMDGLMNHSIVHCFWTHRFTNATLYCPNQHLCHHNSHHQNHPTLEMDQPGHQSDWMHNKNGSTLSSNPIECQFYIFIVQTPPSSESFKPLNRSPFIQEIDYILYIVKYTI